MRCFTLFLTALTFFAAPPRGMAQWTWGESKSSPAGGFSCWDWQDSVQPEQPKREASKWVAYDNGWWKNSVSGHWWHGYYGHYDKDTVWSESTPTLTNTMTEWELENQPEPPNQDLPMYQNRPPVFYNSTPVQFYQPPAPVYMPQRPMFSSPRFSFSGGFRSGSC